MDIFKDSCEEHTGTSLELERFKAKIREIWSRMLVETYKLHYDPEDEESMSEEEYIEHNALRFADEQKLQAILVLEVKVARMRVRHLVASVRKKMTQLLQSIRHS